MANAIPVSQPDTLAAVAPSEVKSMEPVVPGPALAELQVAEARKFAAAAAFGDEPEDKALAKLAKAAKADGKNVLVFGNAVRVDN